MMKKADEAESNCGKVVTGQTTRFRTTDADITASLLSPPSPQRRL